MEDWVEPELTLDHILGARLVSDGILALSLHENGCQITRTHGDASHQIVRVPATVCDKDSQLELVDSQRWVIFGPAGVVLSDDTGLHTLDSHADVARVTADGESLLTAQNNTVQLLNWDGTVRVQRTINGVFKSIERLGSSGTLP